MGSGLNPDINIRSFHALLKNEWLEKKSVKIYQSHIKNDQCQPVDGQFKNVENFRED